MATRLGIPRGGWCPRGGWAEDHPQPPGLRRTHPALRETPSEDPAQRTAWNVRDADATLVITLGDTTSPGTALTLRAAARLGRPHLVVDARDPAAAIRVASFLDGLPAGATLNVAGPRESERPGLGRAAARLLLRVLAERATPG